MIRISALNEEESDEDSNGFDTELIVTKEAEVGEVHRLFTLPEAGVFPPASSASPSV